MMEKLLEVVFMLFVATTTVFGSDLVVDDDDVLVVNVQRFDGNLPPCEPRQVCADVFNFTRDLGDGTGRRESRFIQNCACQSGIECGGESSGQLMFKETLTQSMVTCEYAEEFEVCEDGQIAKEQHNYGGVIIQLNCVCPLNDYPSNFYNKMTIKKTTRTMTKQEKDMAKANRRSRYYRCRAEDEYRQYVMPNF